MQVPALAHFDQMLRFTLFYHSTYYFLAFWGTVGLEQGLWYYRKWHVREMQAADLRTQLARVQLQSLRSQIQPHFLFNALNTVSSTILEGDTDKAYDLTARLGDLLKLSLERGDRELVPLREEIELVESYLDLATARFAERLQVSLGISPDTAELMVPTFVLQPLVENSVKHVVAQGDCRVMLSVRSYLHGDRLALEVEDCPEIRMATAPSSPGTGRGHRLTEERLRGLYGQDYLFRATPAANGGMLILIEIPRRTGAEAAVTL
jgi:LytS/YehU family sensor histidine kinase